MKKSQMKMKSTTIMLNPKKWAGLSSPSVLKELIHCSNAM